MELRFITFNSIVNNNLMPWLAENQDPEKFRLIIRKIAAAQPIGAGAFFKVLPDVFKEMGIDAGIKLTDEWKLFSISPGHKESQQFINAFISLYDDSPKLNFYNLLIANSLGVCFSYMTQSAYESGSETLRKHRIMEWMKTITDMITHIRSLDSIQEVDQTILNRLLAALAVLFEETGKKFPGSVESAVLRINTEDIKHIFTGTFTSDENTKALFRTLAGRYFPVDGGQPNIDTPAFNSEDHKQSSEPQNETELEQTDYKKAIEEVEKVRAEISAVNQALAEAGKKKQAGPETEDRRIGSAEVCALLKISKSTLKAHREKHLYKSTKIGSQYYYSLNEINEKLKLK